MRLRFLPRRKIVLLVLFTLFALGSIFLVLQNIFKADVLGAYTISGQIYAQDTKVPIDSADIILTSSKEDTSAITAKTNAQGQYSLSAPDEGYKNILIVKDKYWDIDGAIVNSGGLTNLNFNTTLRPGFGKEDTQIVTLKKKGYRQKTTVGLSVSPFDEAPAGLKQIIPNGSTYKEEPFKERFSTYDFQEGQKIDANPLNFKFSDVGTLPEVSGALSATYSPDTDRYYLFYPRTIYEYDRNRPENTYKVADLPGIDNSPAIKSIYLSTIKSILIAAAGEGGGKTQIYLFNPQEQKISDSLTALDLPVWSMVLSKDKLYFLTKDTEKTPKTYISELLLSDILADQIKKAPVSIDAVLETNDSSSYYDALSDRIYFIGGKDQNNAELDFIFEFNPNDNTLKQHTKKFAYPIANAAVYSPIPNRYYFIGGTTTNGQPLLDKITFYDMTQNAKTKEVQTFSSGGTNNFKLPNPVANQNAVYDNSNRLWFFGSKVQKIAPALTLQRGQVLSFESGKDYTIAIKGRAKTDEFSFTPKDIQENNWQSASPVKFANPYLRSIALSDITLKYQDKIYALQEAVDQGLINNDVTLNGSRVLDLSKPDTEITPGDYLSYWRKRIGVGVKIALNKNATAPTIIEVPTSVSYDDIARIAEHQEGLPPAEQQYLDEKNRLINDAIQQTLQNNPYFFGDLPHVYLTVNGKLADPHKINPYYANLVSTDDIGINRAKAQTTGGGIDFTYDETSFGTDTDCLTRLKSVTNEKQKIIDMLGEPLFSKKIKIININNENGYYISSSGEMGINCSTEHYRLESTLLHEISHSIDAGIQLAVIAGYANTLDDTKVINEGLAEGFVFSFNTKNNTHYSNMFNSSVGDFDFWSKEIINFYSQHLFSYMRSELSYPDYGTFYDWAYPGFETSTDSLILGRYIPSEANFWTREMPGVVFDKIFTENNDFYKNFNKTFNQELLNRALDILAQNGISKEAKNFTVDDLWEAGSYDEIPFREMVIGDTVFNLMAKVVPRVENQDTQQWIKQFSNMYDDGTVAQTKESKMIILFQFMNSLCRQGDLSETFCEGPAPQTLYNNKNIALLAWGFQEGFLQSGEQDDDNVFSFVMNEGTSTNLRFYSSANLISGQSYQKTTDINGAVNFNDAVAALQGQNYTGRVKLLAITSGQGDLEKSQELPRTVAAHNLYFNQGKNQEEGIYGTIDTDADTVMKLEKIADDGSRSTVAQVSARNGVFNFPDTKDLTGRLVLSFTPIGGTLQEKYFNKNIGSYVLNFKLDTTTPEIEQLCDQEITTNYSYDICFKLNEPASAFIEYGEEKDKYTNISFGANDAGDEVKEGIRTLRLEGLTGDKTYHYRIWAIDRSGNISHTDDKILDKTPISITNIQVSNVTSNSATISWDTNVETSGKITYTWIPPITCRECTPKTLETGFDQIATHHEQILSDLITCSPTGCKYEFRITVAEKIEDGQALCTQDFSGGDFTLLPDSGPTPSPTPTPTLTPTPTPTPTPSPTEHPTCLRIPPSCSVERWWECSNWMYTTLCVWSSSSNNYSCYSAWDYATFVSWMTHVPPYSSCSGTQSASPASLAKPALIIFTPDIKNPVSATVDYGTRKGKYVSSQPMEKVAENTFTFVIPNAKSRTYHYRIVTTDKDGNKIYSDDKTLKYGHWFPRFFNDLFGNFWQWLKERFGSTP